MHRSQSDLSGVDLNLLVALDALLEELSVSAAARRLHLTESAMSRTLGRIRRTVDDPVLVRAGHSMVPTPRALAMRAEVHDLVLRAQAVFAPAQPSDPTTLTRTFTILSSDLLITAIGVDLLDRLGTEAPGVRLRFLPEPDLRSDPLRDGTADLEIGEIDSTAPEILTEAVGEERAIAVVRAGHPLTTGPVTLARLAAARHVTASRRGRLSGPMDEMLAAHGLRREVAAAVPTHAAALVLVANSDLVSIAPIRLGRAQLDALGLVPLDLDLRLPPLLLSQAWHPRHDADGQHRWLRGRVRDCLRQALAGGSAAAGPDVVTRPVAG
ncbi:LysR family transcriptional regulator [Frankia sp. CcI49]|uniref:LysR substrate-binding domain-containing protein n=1 Tax=Frankia sp. CcI49 TaxID=1745382 RepID=UPI0009759B62|nr:LysR substrate-binding domain-containing protein [Frankia sp. CcI49]ONH58455.1 LysR family transcriptional regulator [Frankia sp. CcI49]